MPAKTPKQQELSDKIDSKIKEMGDWKWHPNAHTLLEQLAELRHKCDMMWSLIEELEGTSINYEMQEAAANFRNSNEGFVAVNNARRNTLQQLLAESDFVTPTRIVMSNPVGNIQIEESTPISPTAWANIGITTGGGGGGGRSEG